MSHEIIQLKFEEKDNFIYIIADRETATAFVLDPAWDAEGIAGVLAEENLRLEGILITHSDHDHVNAVAELRGGRTDIAVFVSAPAWEQWPDAPADAVLVADGDEIQLGRASLGVLMTPGHTAGSCCYHSGRDLLTGDTLFIYGAGNVRNPSASAAALFHSLQRLKSLDPQTRIWCGHDYGIAEMTTLAEQLAGNPFLMIDNEADFIRYRTELAARSRRVPYGPISRTELAAVLAQP